MNPPRADRPIRILPAGDSSWPLHGCAASRAIEREAALGLPPHALMQRAGRAAARLALAIAPHAKRIWIACGPGNNGGDGLQAAAVLQAFGKQVECSLLADPARLPDDAGQALLEARRVGLDPSPSSSPRAAPDLVIDALLGLGVNRAPSGTVAAAIHAMRGIEAPVLSLDLPSGLDADRGQAHGEAVTASHTLSLLTLKPALFTAAGRDHAGTVWFDTLGVDKPGAAPPDAWLPGADRFESLHAMRRHGVHKGSYGDAIVIGGAPTMAGAAWLAARAALIAGAGRVYVDPLDRIARLDAGLELMCRPALVENEPQRLQEATVVCGCGAGSAVTALLPAVLEHSARLVLDADALNSIAADSSLRQLLAARRRPTVLTPHPLEAARLLGRKAVEVQSDRLGAAQALADELGCAVLLKGSGSICAAPRLAPFINATGNGLLASAGTGDVLAGWIGGTWSAHSDEPTLAHAQRIAAGAAWTHGAAADLAARQGRRTPLTATALIDAMAARAAAR